MKRILLGALLLVLAYSSNAQTSNVYTKGKNFGVQFTLHDYITADELDSKGTSFVISSKQWKKLSRMRPGIAVSYSEGLNDHFDYNVRLGYSFLEYTLSSQPYAPKTGAKSYFEADASIFMKLTSDAHKLSPFMSLGAGAAKYSVYYSAYIPTGLGLQYNFFDQAYLVAQSQYRIPVTSNAKGNLFYSFGIMANIGKN